MAKQKIFIIVFILAVLGAVYNFYQSSKVAPESSAVEESDTDLVKDLSKIRKLKDSRLDITVFENIVFKNLESAPELAERTPTAGTAPALTPGRANPFLPFQTTPIRK
ncbi:MAG: hypothetical protein Q8R29_01480 [bacterium]|nr:hypothetical protein [bacterium]